MYVRMRAKFKVENESVLLTYDDPRTGNRISETYSVGPGNWGYVRRGDGTQVCDKLKRIGPTLSSNRKHILETIKYEFGMLQNEWKKTLI